MQRKLARIRKENFFEIPKLSDIERSLENILGKFPECGPKCLNQIFTFLSSSTINKH